MKKVLPHDKIDSDELWIPPPNELIFFKLVRFLIPKDKVEFNLIKVLLKFKLIDSNGSCLTLTNSLSWYLCEVISGVYFKLILALNLCCELKYLYRKLMFWNLVGSNDSFNSVLYTFHPSLIFELLDTFESIVVFKP